MGDYGQYDTYDGEEYIRFYIPEGTYLIEALVNNSMVYLEKKEIYKNESGFDESEVVREVILTNAGDTDTITITSDSCISLTINSYVSLKEN